MLNNLRKWFGKRNWRRTFLVHYIVYYDDFPLQAHIDELRQTYALTVLKGDGVHNLSIAIKIRPKQLYAVLSKLPYSVAVSYETKEPGKA